MTLIPNFGLDVVGELMTCEWEGLETLVGQTTPNGLITAP